MFEDDGKIRDTATIVEVKLMATNTPYSNMICVWNDQ